MALTARVPAGAVTAGFVPEIWSQLVLDAIHSQLCAFDAIDKRWQTDLKLGDKVNIGVINVISPTEVVVGTKAASLDIATGTKKQLVINEWWQAPVDIDYMTIRQSQIDWQAQAQKESAYAIAKKMDSTVCALFSALRGGVILGTDGSAITDDLLIGIKELLDEADVPLDNDRALIVDPASIADMMKYDKFVSSLYVQLGAVANGIIAANHPIYGASVRVTNNLTPVAAGTGSYAVMLHRRAIAAAAQMEPSWIKEFEELHLRRYQTEALWGVLEVRDTFGVPFYTRKA